MFNLYKELFLKERNFIIISLFLLIFLTLVFNPKLAMVYGLFIMVIYICKRDYNFPIKLNTVPSNTFQSWMKAGMFYVLFLIISFLFTLFLQFTAFLKIESLSSVMEVLENIGSTMPILAGSKILSVLAFGLIIPPIETVAWGYMTQFLARIFNVNTKRFGLPLILIMVIMSAAFSWFHLQAKGINNTALLLTFVFMMISLYMIFKYREFESATYLHIINNLLAVLHAVGWI